MTRSARPYWVPDRPEFEDPSSLAVFYALAPGSVRRPHQDLPRLGHRRIRRPMFPFDREMPEPGLTARLITAPETELTGPDE
ncbi:hypothetical protein ABZT02_04265 [Streptomyces sp. NPDC005402]|uniref:hypothetical protein n=1 Tax=Streptomyces sp. NPDC005402 TaxID=3155338 RepID=UPI0033A96C48